MIELTLNEVARRHADFPDFIRKIALNNATVAHWIEAYAHGHVISKEEAYCQMVKALAISHDEMIKQLVDDAHMKTVVFIKP